MDFVGAVKKQNNLIEKSKVVYVQPQAFDAEAVKQHFEPHKVAINVMGKKAYELQVVDNATNNLAIEMMGQARALSKQLSTEKDALLRPHNDFRNKVNSLVKYFTGPLEEIVAQLKNKSGDFEYQKIIEQRKKAAEEEKRKAELQAKIDADAADAGVQSIVLPDTPVPDSGGTTRTDSGSSLSVKLEWRGIIADQDKVPREYCVPVQKLIDQAVKSGMREIEGVEIREVPKSRLRA